MEEDEDQFLLSSLGVTSANPEDLEQTILDEATKKLDHDEGGSVEEQSIKKKLEGSSQNELLNKLRAVKFEIDAVASTVEHVDEVADENGLLQKDGGDESDVQGLHSGSVLQHALATDRLKSLKRRKVQLEEEFAALHGQSASTSSADRDNLLRELVKEKTKKKPSLKRKLIETRKPSRRDGKKVKVVSFHEDTDFDAIFQAASTGFVETERDELVRKGILTPFHKLDGFERRLQQPGPSNSRNLPEGDHENEDSGSIDRAVQSMSLAAKARPTTKLLDAQDLPKLEPNPAPFRRLRKLYKTHDYSDNEVKKSKARKKSKKKRPLPESKWRKRISREDSSLQESEDGGRILATSSCEEEDLDDLDDADENETSSIQLEGGLNIPQCIFRNLFEYQRVGVQWLWELHCQRAGGIIGDEMGLGKTVQVLSFLGSLHFSKMYKPSIIICPVTLLRQWRREAQKWYPDFHVELLHDSAKDSGNGKGQGKASESDYDSECSVDSDHEQKKSKNTKKWDSLINRVLNSESGLLITTYEQLRLQGEKLLNIEWGYAVLDEGHRIRNPNSDITLVCKQLQTVHRIIMTGAPIQNKLTELWSLFDFVFPGKLGVLPVFEAEFSVPITVGGYANASPLQVSTAYRCAVVLRDMIMPYLLRRMKADVNAHLTKKTEHVLFCSLTVEQRSTYRAFLASSEVEDIFDGNKNSLYGIDVMRKICNHPDLLEREHSHQNPDYGNPERSGKMKVAAEVLKVWKQQGHRVLLFSQTQQMLDILESFLVANEYSYRRMDGLTPVKQRMALIDEFNNSDDVFVFVLTTKVGGLGTNLTGANRVIIFDPDWNPSNDMQARERAWRIGQKKDVTIYRLITRGTIEEKVYHRQIYKHFLTNKILKNPQQRRFFKARDMKDLFILKDDGDSNASTETSNIFSQLAEEINIVGVQSDNTAEGSSEQADVDTTDKTGEAMDEETNILKSLFDAHGIHSAVNHDAIINANDEEEKMRLEHQASQVARRAAEALRQSRMLRSRESISVPTWTGRSGCAGAPSSVRRRFGSTVNSRLTQTGDKPSVIKNGISAGLSSGKAPTAAELLNRIRGSREQAIGVGNESSLPSSSGSSSRVGSLQPEILIRQICSFVQRKGGSADTTSIVNHFRDSVSCDDKPLFKNLLREIATLEKNQNRSVWVLKSEYKD
ncbi:PREDICTED: protein CHROMATIN REMODELING 8 isoform X1 [Camelina sativa]|uniref:Protein CHROMATIN REMODELING 8 isoform X1 n=1 Tax=Camelina sativa TaxID=90675 RepID=A0ABM1R1H7_CAMSA|nr:PREDICTED: protein CHROMATIN REMODELING 8 isoform X1 [Camelina sativa]XP_019092866.1 PREDICTED: protein CHROMATIN REMODELING 8 isoform X1 [Camelina sativa]